VLDDAADLVLASADTTGDATIRHIEFRNLSDKGHPVYDVYVRPDGTAMVGRTGAPLTATSGYLTADQIAGIAGDPSGMEQRMATLAETLGLGMPGERPERAIYRLATELLSDPGVPAATKAQVYDVIKGFDLDAIKARNLGERTLEDGTTGIELEFRFEEGATDRMLLDRDTGALLAISTVLPDGSVLGGQQYLEQDKVAAVPDRTS